MTEETSADNIGKVWIKDMIDREDGGTDIEVDMDDNVAVKMAHLGLKITFCCAAYEVDLPDVLDWIRSHRLEDNKDD